MKRKTLRFGLVVLCIIAVGLMVSAQVSAEVGVTKDKILFGSFQDMSGPGAYLGKQCSAALAVWKKWVNDDLGGIHGRKVDFVIEDMKYDPVLTKTAFTKLVHQHKVFAIITVYGSTPCTAILGDIKREKIPVFPTAATTQNMFDPPNRYLFWYACSDEDNGIMMVDYIVNDLKVKNPKIGVCYQDDEWGKSARKGVEIGAKKYGFKVAAAAYKRGSKNLNAQAMKLKAKGVTHCFYAGYAPVYAALLQEANKIGWKPLFFGDYVTVDPRAFMAGKLADGNYHFFNLGLRHERGPGWINMEKMFTDKLGAEAAKQPLSWRLMPLMWTPLLFLTQALQDIGPDLTREKLISALENIKDFDTGGLGKIQYGPGIRKGTHEYRVLKCDFEKKDFFPVTGWRRPSIEWGSKERPRQK
ncbi:MAG: ABC transporter substrate-binding protein [Deltaproteobacteria bacterium]|nr:ABC transporter substrate-binding protein [Deltaproteobacteria bacterium]